MSDTFTLGRYTVRIGLRHDNPAFAAYLIYRGAKFIGKQFSYPSESDCAWLERENGVYATNSQFLGSCVAKHRKPGPGRPRRNATHSTEEALET